MVLSPHVRRIDSLQQPGVVDALTDILIDCVEGGASVSFMLPLSRDRAEQFWRSKAEAIESGDIALLGAWDDQGRLLGTVQLVLSQPDNQPHRADIAKLLVHRHARRGGMGAALMAAAEQTASQEGKTLLVLDTATGGGGERLYTRLGWQLAGIIPDFALMPDGALTPTSVFYKAI